MPTEGNQLPPLPLTQTIEFKVRQYAAFSRLHPEIFVSSPGNAWADPIIHYWTVGFKAYVPVHEIATAKWPKSGWDWFKQRWFPAWAKRRWPVKYSFFEAVQLMDLGPHPRCLGATRSLAYTAGFSVNTSEKSLLPLRSVVLDLECPHCHDMFHLRDGLGWQAKEEGA